MICSVSSNGTLPDHAESAGTVGPPAPRSAPDPAAGPSPGVGLRVIFARFWPDTRPVRAQWVLTLLLVAVAPALSAAAIWLFKVLIDQVVVPHQFRLFPLLAGAYLALALVQGAVSFADQYLSTWVGEKFVLSLRTRLFDRLHRLPPGFFERRQLGDILSRLTGDIGAIEELVLSGIAQALTYAFQLAWFTGALFLLNWRLAAASLLAAPAFLGAARFFSARIKNASREKRRRAGAITSVAEESLSNAALVRAYHRRDAESARFATENQGSFDAQMAATRLQALFGPLTDLLEVVGVLSVIGLAVWELSKGRISIGGLMAFVAYLTQLYGPVQGAGRLMNSLYAASAGAERVIELLDEAPSVTEPVNPRPLGRARGAIGFEQVSFSYERFGPAAVSGLDFVVRPGEKIAVVGASGAGKSTLAKLLLRFSDPVHGSITIDEVDLRELSHADLYRNVAAVLQETLVFDGTIRDNILWGRPEASEADVVAAARAADAHEFIMAFPLGYDTRVGQRGRMLSGGQRQRLAIARAMIRDAPILLLDEPTTGLDAESTRRVLGPLRRLMAGRTTLIISHNLLTVTDADRILFLEGGRITGQGPHSALMATNDGYARLYRLHSADPGASGASGAMIEPPEYARWRPAAAASASASETSSDPATGLGGAAGVDSAAFPLGGAATPEVSPAAVALPERRLTAAAARSVPGPRVRPTPHERCLRVDRVRLHGPGMHAGALGEVSFTVERDRCLALLGSDGAGKSMLLRLLAGLEEPAHGEIHFRGRPVRDACAAGLTVSLMRPVPEVFEGTIADVIKGGRAATAAEVVAAARAGDAHRFITSLSGAYATRLGDHGQRLSDEQRVRIGVARALLGDPDLLLLDDPTVGVDARARNDLLALLCTITAGRIVVVATDDRLVAAAADHRLWLDDPRATHGGPQAGEHLGLGPLSAVSRLSGTGRFAAATVRMHRI